MWHLTHDVHKVIYFNILTHIWSMFYNHFMSNILQWLLILSPKCNYFLISPLQIALPTTPGAWTLSICIYLYLFLLNLIFSQYSLPCQLSILFSAINYPHSHHLSFGLLLPFLISCCHQNDLFKMQIKELYYLGKKKKLFGWHNNGGKNNDGGGRNLKRKVKHQVWELPHTEKSSTETPS